MKAPAMTAESLINSWNRFRKLPGGQALFSQLVKVVVPYTGTLGATVEELEAGHVKLSLRDRRGVRNHLKSIHAMALANFGEMVSGLSVITALPPGARAILTGFSIEYLKKARGTLHAECRYDLVKEVTERKTVPVKADIRDEAGDVVARVTAQWLVGPEKK